MPFRPHPKHQLEIHFFDQMHLRGDDIKHLEGGFQHHMHLNWNEALEKRWGRPVVIDKSPTYVRHPFVPCRIKKLWQDAKIIIQVRFGGIRAAMSFVRWWWRDGGWLFYVTIWL